MLKQLKSLPDLTGSKIKIAVGGNCNTDFLLPGLKVKLADLHVANEIINLSYDSWLQTVQQNIVQADYWVVWLSSLGATSGGTKDYSFDLDNILAAINHLNAQNAKVILILPEKLEISFDMYAPLYQEYLELKNALISALPKQVLLIDPEVLHATMGDQQWYAGRYWSNFKAVCHPDAVTELACYTANIIAKSIRPQVKAVVVDLDNTLWGGVVGEDGVENLLLDPNAEGRPFIQMQFLLKQLSDRGIPLCVVSKNNIADAKAPFESREEMLLKLDDFVYFVANWEHKSKNIQEIADKLKLNVDSICFLDDSVHERAEIRSALPTLIVPELPDEANARIGILVSSGIFTTPNLSSVDLERAQYYKTEVKREELQAKAVDFKDYLIGLEMQLEPIAISADNLPRVVSLINRTNQFNLTNRRHTAAELAQIIATPGVFAYCYKLQDKFGDSGIIAVLIATKNDNNMHIDTFLMSCRVLNRHVEFAIYEHFIDAIKQSHINNLTAEYIKSAKNILVQDLYLDLGFTVVDANISHTKYICHEQKAPWHSISLKSCQYRELA